MKKQMILGVGILTSLFCLSAYAEKMYVDIYKSNQFSINDVNSVIKTYQPQIEKAHRAMVEGKYDQTDKLLEPFQKRVREVVNSKGKFTYLSFDFVLYPKDSNDYLTINVVDEADKASISVYAAAPTGQYPDPAHLIADWKAYEKKAMPLYMSGKLSSNTMACTAFHCLGSFRSPALRAYEKEFNAEVPKHQAELVEILKNDKEASNRATAVFLLAHSKDEKQLIDYLLPALNDPSMDVRNNATRVLANMSYKNREITLPVETFIKMLESPVLSDRNKALMVLCGLSDQPRYAAVIKQQAGPAMIESLKLHQPNLHRSAYLLLKNISKKNYPDRDYAAWSHWLGLS